MQPNDPTRAAPDAHPTPLAGSPWGDPATMEALLDAFAEENSRLLDATRPMAKPMGPWGSLETTSITCDAFAEENDRLRAQLAAARAAADAERVARTTAERRAAALDADLGTVRRDRDGWRSKSRSLDPMVATRDAMRALDEGRRVLAEHAARRDELASLAVNRWDARLALRNRGLQSVPGATDLATLRDLALGAGDLTKDGLGHQP